MLQPERFARIAEAMGIDTSRLSVRKAAERSVEIVERLLDTIHLKLRLRDYGVTESDLKKLAEDVFGYMGRCLDAHPRVFSQEEIIQVYREML
jgi:alcohol dehydrogenase class IV